MMTVGKIPVVPNFLCAFAMSQIASLTGASFCQNCPAGRYSNQIGLSSGDDCTPVPHGKYANASGTDLEAQEKA